MSLVWQCDRCMTVSRDGLDDFPPDEWVMLDMPVRGSQGARSRSKQTICRSCDDDLYGWFTNPREEAAGILRAAIARKMAQGVADAARRCAENSENDKGPCRCCGDEEPT